MASDDLKYTCLDIWGGIYLLASERGLCRIAINQNFDECLKKFKNLYGRDIVRDDRYLAPVSLAISGYLNGKIREFNLNIDLEINRPTNFQIKAWKALMAIPYGQTRSYKWEAHQIGSPRAFRAAGSANGANPLPIIIPCHRVINSDGGPGGYSGGIDIKRKLLELEGVHLKWD